MLPTARTSISMILRTTHTRTAAAWHVVLGKGTVNAYCDLWSPQWLANTNLSRIIHLRW